MFRVVFLALLAAGSQGSHDESLKNLVAQDDTTERLYLDAGGGAADDEAMDGCDPIVGKELGVPGLEKDEVASPDMYSKPDQPSVKLAVRLVVVTDPRTDVTEDDMTALCALAALNKDQPFASSIKALVTGKKGTLDARYQGIKFLEAHGVTIELAPAKNYADRFWAPYGDIEEADKLYESETSLEKVEEKKGEKMPHIVDRIPDDTTALIVIGQVEGDFFDKLAQAKDRLQYLKEFSMQGPGFNVMANPKINTGAKITAFIDAYSSQGLDVRWSDQTSNLMISSEDNNARFDALSKLNPAIIDKKKLMIVSFWATSAKPDNFEGQMGDRMGYNYFAHTEDLLQTLVQSRCIEKLTFEVGKEVTTANHNIHKAKNEEDKLAAVAAGSMAVLKHLKQSWMEKEGLHEHFKGHPEDCTKLVDYVQSKCAIQGSRTYDGLNAIEYGLRKQQLAGHSTFTRWKAAWRKRLLKTFADVASWGKKVLDQVGLHPAHEPQLSPDSEDLVHLAHEPQLSPGLGLTLQENRQSTDTLNLPSFLGTGNWSGTYIGMPQPSERDKSDRTQKCSLFHKFSVHLINRLREA